MFKLLSALTCKGKVLLHSVMVSGLLFFSSQKQKTSKVRNFVAYIVFFPPFFLKSILVLACLIYVPVALIFHNYLINILLCFGLGILSSISFIDFWMFFRQFSYFMIIFKHDTYKWCIFKKVNN